MDEARTATATSRRSLVRRYPWLGPGGLLLILTFLTVNVLANGPAVAADRRIRAAVIARAGSAGWRWLKADPWSPARVLVEMGNIRVAVPALAVFAAAAAIQGRSVRPLFTAMAGVALLLGTVVPAKILTARPNPGQSSLNGQLLGAFPSGHTSTASVCYFLAALLISAGLSARARRAWLAVAAALSCLVGVAMIWCDLHWFTDVAASWALSPLLIQLTLRLSRLRAGPASSGASSGAGPPGTAGTRAAPAPGAPAAADPQATARQPR